ncbi:MAG: class I SAM-dependent methyltransferase [Anaerolineae bacterium]|nr:class I SAM-dependent methyltransferase [Anaerolineae bacterium]
MMSKRGCTPAALRAIRQRLVGSVEKEWQRLESTPITRTEYVITSHCLERYLPPYGLLLDAGCGPGRYAVDLVKKGYRVVLFDLMHDYLRFARDKVLETGVEKAMSIPVEGDLGSLPYADGVFDAVLSLGAPLSYILDAGARSCAVIELARVVKPGGRVFLTGIGRLAAYRGGIYWAAWELFDLFIAPDARKTGRVPGYDYWYTFAKGELDALAEVAGLSVEDRVGCEGMASYLPMDHLEQVENNPHRWLAWKELLLETCNEPSIIGLSNHQLIIARKIA